MNKSFDEIIVERLKRSAAGLPHSDGRSVSQLDQLLAQGALTHRAVRAFGGRSLFSLVNGLHSEAMFDYRRTEMLSWHLGSMGRAAEIYFSVVMSDIAAGRLIVREPLNFLRCNDLPEIQMLPNLCEGFASMAILVRYAVKDREAASWLEGQGLAVPAWLQPSQGLDESAGTGADLVGEARWVDQSNDAQSKQWSDELTASKIKLRLQIDAIQVEIEARDYIPTNIPIGGVADLEKVCKSTYPKVFNGKSSFDNAWRELVGMGKVRSCKHEACGGKALDR